MGRQLLDLQGTRIGRLVLRERAPLSKEGFTQWVCDCDCGNTKIIRQGSLRAGLTVSCGCRMGETHRSNFMYAGDDAHGFSGKPIYREWVRLTRGPHDIDERWTDIVKFVADVGADLPFEDAKIRGIKPGKINVGNMVWTT